MAKFNITYMLPHICVHTYKKTLPNIGEDVDQPNSRTDLVKTWNDTSHLENNLADSYKANYTFMHATTVPHLGY